MWMMSPAEQDNIIQSAIATARAPLDEWKWAYQQNQAAQDRASSDAERKATHDENQAYRLMTHQDTVDSRAEARDIAKQNHADILAERDYQHGRDTASDTLNQNKWTEGAPMREAQLKAEQALVASRENPSGPKLSAANLKDIDNSQSTAWGFDPYKGAPGGISTDANGKLQINPSGKAPGFGAPDGPAPQFDPKVYGEGNAGVVKYAQVLADHEAKRSQSAQKQRAWETDKALRTQWYQRNGNMIGYDEKFGEILPLDQPDPITGGPLYWDRRSQTVKSRDELLRGH
jgi:hypothetical protein